MSSNNFFWYLPDLVLTPLQKSLSSSRQQRLGTAFQQHKFLSLITDSELQLEATHFSSCYENLHPYLPSTTTSHSPALLSPQQQQQQQQQHPAPPPPSLPRPLPLPHRHPDDINLGPHAPGSRALSQNHDDDVQGWHMVYRRGNPQKDTDALVVFRRRSPTSGLPKKLYEYKAFGAAPYSIDVFFQVLTDLEYHKEWDSTSRDIRILRSLDAKSHHHQHQQRQQHKTRQEEKEDDSNRLKTAEKKGKLVKHDLVYWEVDYPWPLKRRDYVYVRKIRCGLDHDHKGSPIWLHATKAVPKSAEILPTGKNCVRVQQSKTLYIVRPRDKNVTEFIYTVLDDPQGNIPSQLVNKIANMSMVGFLRKMYKACRNLDMNTVRKHGRICDMKTCG